MSLDGTYEDFVSNSTEVHSTTGQTTVPDWASVDVGICRVSDELSLIYYDEGYEDTGAESFIIKVVFGGGQDEYPVYSRELPVTEGQAVFILEENNGFDTVSISN